MKLKPLFILPMLLLAQCCVAQTKGYQYKRALSQNTESWNKIELPVVIYGQITPDLRDLRIIGTTADDKTVEAPYILSGNAGKSAASLLQFEIINKSSTDRGYYYSFRAKKQSTINTIKLTFLEQNFDWKIKLEGSTDLQNWFTVIEDYRIVSLDNEKVDFTFTNIIFPESEYKYYRIFIPASKQPSLITAGFQYSNQMKKKLTEYPAFSLTKEVDEKAKLSVYFVTLPHTIPLAAVKIEAANKIDYYRIVNIEYLVDSINSEKGWIYNYRTITSSMLTSVDSSAIKVPETFTRNLKITIEENDNVPLDILNVKAYSYRHELFTRITTPARYSLYYGNENATKPIYDLENFENKIPENMPFLTLGNEQKLITDKNDNSISIINKWWLWTVLGVVMLLLLVFSLKMLREGKS